MNDVDRLQLLCTQYQLDDPTYSFWTKKCGKSPVYVACVVQIEVTNNHLKFKGDNFKYGNSDRIRSRNQDKAKLTAASKMILELEAYLNGPHASVFVSED